MSNIYRSITRQTYTYTYRVDSARAQPKRPADSRAVHRVSFECQWSRAGRLSGAVSGAGRTMRDKQIGLPLCRLSAAASAGRPSARAGRLDFRFAGKHKSAQVEPIKAA